MAKKWIFGLLGAAAIGAGAYCAYKKFAPKNEEDDFDDDIDEFDLDEEDEESREYVSINIKPEDSEDAVEDAVEEVKEEVEDAKDAFDK